MPALYNKALSAKRAWAKVTDERNRFCFGFIASLGLLYKAGILSKQQVADKLNEERITREDLRRFRAARAAAADQSGQVLGFPRAGDFPEAEEARGMEAE